MPWIVSPVPRHLCPVQLDPILSTVRPQDHGPLPDGCLVHSFRHSFLDRLRAARCPADIIDALGGWSTAGIGSNYGDGFELSQKSPWMREL